MSDGAQHVVVSKDHWNALAHFVRWAISEGAWQGGDLDGIEVQEKAEKLGLIVSEPGGYDEKKHGPDDYAEKGDPYFVYAPFLRGDAKPLEVFGSAPIWTTTSDRGLL